MNDNKLDFVVSLTDSPIHSIAAIGGMNTLSIPLRIERLRLTLGLPSANVPLGYLEPSGRPFGLTFVAKAGEEARLSEVMAVYEETFPKRRLPQALCVSPNAP